MKLAVSNLAWDAQDNQEVFKLLNDLDINNVEGVLSKIDSWDNLTKEKIQYYSDLLKDNNLGINSLQSLFFNVKCDDISNVDVILTHFQRLIDYSKILSVNVLVFGTPSLRKKINEWENYLIEIFTKLDEMLEGTGIYVLIEPNSKVYGGEFFHNLSEITDFILTNKLKNIKTMIDTHNLLLEGYDPVTEIETHYPLINHIHISEEKLKPLTDHSFHIKFSNKIKSMGYNKTVTYELNKCDNLQDTLKVFSTLYQ
jgi:sugar phosphate isomerase/epimerase